MSSPPANIASLIVLAGFGIAAGVTILYNYLTNSDSEEENNQSTLIINKRQSTTSSEIPTQSSSIEYLGRQLSTETDCQRWYEIRGISPPREIISNRQQRFPPPSESTSERSHINRIHKWQGNIIDCQICKKPMPISRIELNCSHIFHDKCYTIWRHEVVMQNPYAKLCPIC